MHYTLRSKSILPAYTTDEEYLFKRFCLPFDGDEVVRRITFVWVIRNFLRAADLDSCVTTSDSITEF